MKLYIDTSVYSAMHDEDPLRVQKTKALFNLIGLEQNWTVFVSDVLMRELSKSKNALQVFQSFVPVKKRVETIPQFDIMHLADMYIKRLVLPAKSKADALHIAYATLYEADMLITWNMKHMAKETKKDGINLVNQEFGHKLIRIIKPDEL